VLPQLDRPGRYELHAANRHRSQTKPFSGLGSDLPRTKAMTVRGYPTGFASFHAAILEMKRRKLPVNVAGRLQ